MGNGHPNDEVTGEPAVRLPTIHCDGCERDINPTQLRRWRHNDAWHDRCQQRWAIPGGGDDAYQVGFQLPPDGDGEAGEDLQVHIQVWCGQCGEWLTDPDSPVNMTGERSLVFADPPRPDTDPDTIFDHVPGAMDGVDLLPQRPPHDES